MTYVEFSWDNWSIQEVMYDFAYENLLKSYDELQLSKNMIRGSTFWNVSLVGCLLNHFLPWWVTDV